MKKLQLLALLALSAAKVLSQNVGIGTTTPTAKLHVGGNVKIDSAYTLEFGAGIAGKEINAGKIGYRAFSAAALDIVGAGPTNNRKITFWAEGGALFKGTLVVEDNVTLFGNSTVDNNLTVTGSIDAGLSYYSADYVLPSGNMGQYSIGCPSDKRLVSGGGGHRDNNTAAADITVNYSGPDLSLPLSAWRLIVTNRNGSASRTIRIYCTCARIN